MRTAVRAAWLLGSLSLAAAPAVPADPAGDTAQVRVDGERLSLHVDDMPLGELLATLERSGGVRVEVHGGAPSGVRVSDSFDDADVAQALRRVLSAHSHLLIDRGTSQGAPRVIELILFSATPGAERAAAAEELAYPSDAGYADQVLVQHFSDPDEQVRSRALETLRYTARARGERSRARAD